MSGPKDSLQVPQSGWLNALAETGLPRRGSFGFNENYVSDSAPPFCSLDDDSASGISSSPKNTFVSGSPSTSKRIAFTIPVQDLPSPSENLLFSYFENHKSANADLVALELDGNRCHASADSPCEDDHQFVTPTTPKLHSKALRDAAGSLTEKVVDCITMDNFPVATAESLVELDRLKKQILFGECDMKNDHVETIEPSPNMDGEPLDGACRVRFESSSVPSKDEHQKNKLATLLFNQPFAQNWFFKNSTHSDSTTSMTNSSQASRIKEINIWAPHNL